MIGKTTQVSGDPLLPCMCKTSQLDVINLKETDLSECCIS